MKSRITLSTKLLIFILLLLSNFKVFAQQNIGLAGGNYSGISGIWLNPAGVVDSRYKFDMNIYSFDSYFDNNYLEIKNGTLVRKLLKKSPYNSSFTEVKNDLLSPIQGASDPVNMRISTEWQLPLSFMATTGKNSGIAFNLRNRTAMVMEGMNYNTAQMLFGEIRDPKFFGQEQVSTNFEFGFLNWQEVNLTYGRVLLNSKHHFLKTAFTGKLLGANAAGFIQSDRIAVTFNDTDNISINSDEINYARTERADFGSFARKDIFNNVEDYSFGWDFGFIYELRGNNDAFHFKNLDNQESERKDLNKYILRFGVSILDGGRFKMKRRELTNDHSAAINSWDISDVNAHGFNTFDEAYSELITYNTDNTSDFTYQLPTALSLQLDLHLLKGFYINATAYRDVTDQFQKADMVLKAHEWTTVTPRFETRSLGFYLPVTYADKKVNAGATVRLGPFYAGSNNLLEVLANSKNSMVDFHAGIRISIPYGKPSILKKKYENVLKLQGGVSSNRKLIDSLSTEVNKIKGYMLDTLLLARQVVVNNYYGPDSTKYSSQQLQHDKTNTSVYKNDTVIKRLESENDYLMNELAATQLYADKLLASDSILLSDNTSKSDKKKALEEKRRYNDQKKFMDEQLKNQNDMEKETKRIRRQMTAMVVTTGVIAAATVASVPKDTTNKNTSPPAAKTPSDTLKTAGTTGKDSVSVAPTVNDSLQMMKGTQAGVNAGTQTNSGAVLIAGTSPTSIVHDTVIVRDTVFIEKIIYRSDTTTAKPVSTEPDLKKLSTPVYFKSGSVISNPSDLERMKNLALWLFQNPDYSVNVTGFTDASGSASVNLKIANDRANAVSAILIQNGISENRIHISGKIAPKRSSTKTNYKDRRSEIQLIRN